MRPQRPYLLRAFYDWLLDSQLTPLIVVNTNYANVDVPNEFIRDGQIILNIAPHAVGQFNMTDEAISFSARFSGAVRHIYVPMGALSAIYARENGAGTIFNDEEVYHQPPAATAPAMATETKQKMHVIESDSTTSAAESTPKTTTERKRPNFTVIK